MSEHSPRASGKNRADPLYSFAVTVGRAVFGLLRVRPRETGLENLPAGGGAVLAITHFGYLDFALVEWRVWKHDRRHVRFLATKGAFDKPVVGTLLRGMKHIPVDMGAGADAYRRAVEALRAGETLGVFPEGGVNASFTVRELKTGAVRMAAEAGVPVIPVAVWGGHRLKTKGGSSAARERFGVPVGFAFGEAFEPSPTDDPAEVTVTLHSTLQRLVDELQAAYPVDGRGRWWQPAHLGGTAPTPEAAAVTEAARQARKRAARER